MQPPNQPPWPPSQGPRGSQPQAFGPQHGHSQSPQPAHGGQQGYGQQQQGYGQQQQGYGQQHQGYGQQHPQGPGQAGVQPGFSAQPPKKKSAGLIIGIVAAVSLAAVGVGGYLWYANDQAERKETLARLCVDTTEHLSSPSDNPDTFSLQVSNVLKSCSAACERGDDPSCDQFEEHLNVMCGADPSTCEKLCKTLTAPKMKKAACDFEPDDSKPKKPKSAKPPGGGESPPVAGAFTSSAGRFSAKFPFGEPVVKSEVQSGVTWHETGSKTGLYFVSYADFPDAAKASAAMAEYLSNTKNSQASLRDLTVAGVPGKEVVFQISNESTMWLRAVVVGNRFYKVTAGNKNNKAKADEFLDSFTLKR